MSRVFTRDRGPLVPVELKPLGSGGLDKDTAPSMLDSPAMQVARNVDTTTQEYQRRLGDVKIAQFTDLAATQGSKVFGTTAKYATIPAVAIPTGSWVLRFHFLASRAAAKTWLLDSAQDVGFAHYIFRLSLSNAGVFEVKVMWSDASTSTITTAALTDDSEQHGLLVFDAIAGTLTLYLNGVAAGTPVSGLSSTKKPWQGVSVAWYVAVSFEPTVGVAANSAFEGALDDFTLLSYPAVDLTAGADATLDPPKRSLLQEHLWRNWLEWSNPADLAVLWNYGMDEATAGTGSMYDSSDAKRHGTYAGSPANAANVAVRQQNGNWLGCTRRANVGSLEDGRVNIAIVAGSHYVETMRSAHA